METKHRETKSDITPPSGRHVLAPYTIQWALRRPSGRHPFREPWRVRGLGRPWRSRGFRKPLRVHLRARGPSPRLSLYGRSSVSAGSWGRSGSANTWGRSGNAVTWGRSGSGTPGGALTVRALASSGKL